jgi:hypothetical protein
MTYTLSDEAVSDAVEPGPGPRHRGIWLTVALLTAAVVFAPTAVSAYSWLIQQTATTSWSATHAVSAVDVTVDGGDVNVRPGGQGAVSVDATLTWDIQRPIVRESWLGDSLVVSASCPGHSAFAAHDCGTSLDIKVPAATSVTVTARSGGISVADISGEVRAQTMSGDIALEGTAGALWAHAVSGTVSAQAIASPQADVGTKSGDVSLQFAAPPQRVVSDVISGDTSILVPQAGGYLITGRTVSGQRNIDSALENGTSTRMINVSSVSGDVDVEAQG